MIVAASILAFWLVGFLPSLWCMDAMNRCLNRQFPGLRSTRTDWTDIRSAAALGLLGPCAAIASCVGAVGFELSYRRKWSARS